MGRERETERLRALTEADRPTFAVLTGPAGVGKSALLREWVRDRDVIYSAASPVAGEERLRELEGAVARWRASKAADDPRSLSVTRRHAGRRPRLPPGTPEARWQALFQDLADSLTPESPPFDLVIDDAAALAELEPGLDSVLTAFMARARQRQLPVLVLLSGSLTPPLRRWLEGPGGLTDELSERIELEPLPLREASLFYPRLSPEERIRAYSIFGGMPGTAALFDDSRTIRRNVLRLVLEPGAPLRKTPLQLLRRELQNIGRYASIVASVGRGARRWGEILAGAGGFDSGSQMAPYLRRLEELGLIRSLRSLDDEPGSRNRRYEIPDPFQRFWYRFVLSHGSELGMARSEEVWARSIDPQLDAYVGSVFPLVCRQFLTDHATELFAVPSREIGSIWSGDGSVEIDVAGSLEGGGICYGVARWNGAGVEALEELNRSIRRTRYGVARLARTRLLFGREIFSAELRSIAASDELVRLVGVDRIVGEADLHEE